MGIFANMIRAFFESLDAQRVNAAPTAAKKGRNTVPKKTFVKGNDKSKFEACFREANDAYQTFKPAEVKWISNMVCEYYLNGEANFSLLLRKNTGVLMDKEGLKEAGLRGNVVFSKKLYNALSSNGRKSPLTSIKSTIAAARKAFWRVKKIEHASINNEVFIVDYGDNCGATKTFYKSKQIFEISDLPVFPAPSCDTKYCFCHFFSTSRHTAEFIVSRRNKRNS